MKNQNIGSNHKTVGAGRVNTANPGLALPSNGNPSPTVLRELRVALGKVLGVAEAPQAGPPDQPNGQPLNVSGNGRPVTGEPAITSSPTVTLQSKADPSQRPKTFAIPEGLLDSACHIPHSTMGATRTGKIARLPLAVREEVNQMLRSGHSYDLIAQELEKLGHPGMSACNISAWKHGGYVEWLREQQYEERNLRLPLALERCTRNVQLDRLQQNALVIATGQLTQIIARFDVERALDLLYNKPQLFPAFIASLSSLGRCSAELTKTFEVVQAREQVVRDQIEIPITRSEQQIASEDPNRNREDATENSDCAFVAPNRLGDLSPGNLPNDPPASELEQASAPNRTTVDLEADPHSAHRQAHGSPAESALADPILGQFR